MSTVPWLLGLAWGVIAAAPFVRRARRIVVVGRARSTRPVPTAARHRGRWGRRARALGARSSGPVGRVVADVRRRRLERVGERALQRELPVTLDLLGVAVDAGCTPYVAVETAAHWAPPPVAARFDRVLRACRMGAAFADALHDAARTAPPLAPVVDALLTADRLGAPVGPALARLATEERTALRRRAEAHARRVPVRLLFPLVFLVLPAFVLLTVVPGLASGLARL
jgi:tight adherence protein C